MRLKIIALLLLVLNLNVATVKAGVLTNGNIFAEGLAGCSIGVAAGLISSTILPTVIPATSATIMASLGTLQGCVLGGAALAAINSAIYFSDFSKDIFNPYQPLGNTSTMIYPPTPGKKY